MMIKSVLHPVCDNFQWPHTVHKSHIMPLCPKLYLTSVVCTNVRVCMYILNWNLTCLYFAACDNQGEGGLCGGEGLQLAWPPTWPPAFLAHHPHIVVAVFSHTLCANFGTLCAKFVTADIPTRSLCGTGYVGSYCTLYVYSFITLVYMA